MTNNNQPRFVNPFWIVEKNFNLYEKDWQASHEEPLGQLLFGQIFIYDNVMYCRVVKEGGEPFPTGAYDSSETTLGVQIGHWHTADRKWSMLFPMIQTFTKGQIVKVPRINHPREILKGF